MAVVKPVVGADIDNWGQILNDALDGLDARIDSTLAEVAAVDDRAIGPYRSDWSASISYDQGDVVRHNGQLWVATRAPSAGSTPGATLTRSNNAEGGTHGTVVTTGNSGGTSGNAFDTIQIPTSGSVTFTNSPVREGSLAYAINGGGTGSGTFGSLVWGSLGAPTKTYSRFWWRTTVIDGTSYMQWINLSGGNLGFLIRLTAGGLLQIAAGSGGNLATAVSPALATDTWYRIETYAEAGIGCTVRAYDTNGALLGELAYSGAGATGTVTNLYHGYNRNTAVMHFDAIEYSKDFWPSDIGAWEPFWPDAPRTGTATLVAGTATVNDALITANSRIFLTCQVPGGTPGFLRISARTAGVSFAITSSSATDTSTVAYQIIEP